MQIFIGIFIGILFMTFVVAPPLTLWWTARVQSRTRRSVCLFGAREEAILASSSSPPIRTKWSESCDTDTAVKRTLLVILPEGAPSPWTVHAMQLTATLYEFRIEHDVTPYGFQYYSGGEDAARLRIDKLAPVIGIPAWYAARIVINGFQGGPLKREARQ